MLAGMLGVDLVRQYQDHVAALARGTSSALAEEGYDSVAIHSGSLMKRSDFDDQYWPLSPVPHFRHWAHFEWPEAAIHFEAERRPRLIFARDRSFWERMPEPDWSFLAAALDLVEVPDAEAVGRALREEASGRKRMAFITDPAKKGAEWGGSREDVNPRGLLPKLDDLRVFKTPYEITCLTEANRIASLGHEAVREAFLRGERSELKLHLTFLEATHQDDPETPYKNIVALGEAASILHHVHYRRTPIPAKSLLLDAGATFRGYASDITRTYVDGDHGDASALFSDLIQRMESMQRALVASVKIGRPYESLHDEAHERLARILTETGLVRMSTEECVTSGVSRRFLPHGLGHSLGIQTHDVGCAKIRPRSDNPFLRNTRAIEPSQVFTIEPGLYFIDTFLEELRSGAHSTSIDWRKVDALMPYGGIRIEDDVVVLEDAPVSPSRNLTREALSPRAGGGARS